MESLLGNSHRRPDVIFFKSGRIDITKRIADAIGIHDGDVLDIAHEDGEYYLYVYLKSRPEGLFGTYEGVCHPTHQGKKGASRNFRAYSKRLCRCILNAAGAGEKAAVLAGSEATVFGKKAVIIIPRTSELYK